MNIKIKELESLCITYLVQSGFSEKDAGVITYPLLKAELSGKKTHGINKLLQLGGAISEREGKPEIIKEKFNYALINAHKELGFLSADFACDIIISKAREFDSATVAVINSYYYGMASVYAEKISQAGFISLIFNNGGPAIVAPFGGIDPLFGTNPIAIGIPTAHGPVVLDMATSERSFSEISLAKSENRGLPANAFLDKSGNFTTDPENVNAIIPFGKAKGYGLNVMTEILTGAMVGTKMGLQSENSYDLGFLFMAFSPIMFSTEAKFYQNVEQLIQEVKNSRKSPDVDEIFLPGEKSAKLYKEAMDKGSVEISDELWNKIRMIS